MLTPVSRSSASCSVKTMRSFTPIAREGRRSFAFRRRRSCPAPVFEGAAGVWLISNAMRALRGVNDAGDFFEGGAPLQDALQPVGEQGRGNRGLGERLKLVFGRVLDHQLLQVLGGLDDLVYAHPSPVAGIVAGRTAAPLGEPGVLWQAVGRGNGRRRQIGVLARLAYLPHQALRDHARQG